MNEAIHDQLDERMGELRPSDFNTVILITINQ
jgi:hypothetical protein